jgi:hypothetical protein
MVKGYPEGTLLRQKHDTYWYLEDVVDGSEEHRYNQGHLFRVVFDLDEIYLRVQDAMDPRKIAGGCDTGSFVRMNDD